MIVFLDTNLIEDEFPGQQVIVATTNLKHLSLFCNAANWRDIKL